MISFKSKGIRFPVESFRYFSVGSLQCQKSHYETLKVSESASQAEVKSAYYKLSKRYHPDTNVNDPTATAKFQEISEAYEVLGNEDSRMRYDKGMAPVDRLNSIRKERSKVPEDPKASFYKSRLHNKMNTPTTGRIYNFDDWTKSHYSASLKSNRILKEQNLNIKTTVNYSGGKVTSPAKKLQESERRLAFTLLGIFIVGAILFELDQPDSPKRLK